MNILSNKICWCALLCLIINSFIYPSESYARRILTLWDYQIHKKAQEACIVTNIEKERRTIQRAEIDTKYDANGQVLTFHGITLVTGIEDDAKKALIEKIEELKNNNAVSGKINFVKEESLHMTIADLITSEKLYSDAKTPVTAEDKDKLLKAVVKAIEDFVKRYQGKGVELKVSVNGIGMFESGVLFFSVHVEEKQFTELKALRDEISKNLAHFNKPTEFIRPEYVTHITIGYLKPGVKLDPNDKNDREFFEVLSRINKELEEHPITFGIKKGVVVPFTNMDTYGINGDNNFEEGFIDVDFQSLVNTRAPNL